MNTVYTAADNKKVTALVALDIWAAFDTIDHDILIDRLECQFGVNGAESRWLRSYLAGRKQFVQLSGHSSSTTQPVCGVPQGSVLGPLMFTTYMSPVGELIESYGILSLIHISEPTRPY